MSAPITSKSAVLLKDSTPIGFIRDIEVRASADVVRDHFMGDQDPAILEQGRRTYTWRFAKGYIDKTYAELLTGGVEFDLELRPEGSGSGKPKVTLSDCVMTGWRVRFEAFGTVFEDCEGEAKSIAFGTQSES